MYKIVESSDFDAIRLRLASPDQIRIWSHGEVTRPETINYRTQKPEKDGLFCERIFGPSKDWECYCGKYKKIRYKGIVCDKCGVEVTRSMVRRERMGHIDLVVPVTHIWFLRGVPSKIGLILDVSVQNLEKVVYFANFIVIEVNEELRKSSLEDLRKEYKNKQKELEMKFASNDDSSAREEAQTALQAEFESTEQELKELRVKQLLTEYRYQELSLKYGHVFEAGIGAEAVQYLLDKIDVPEMIAVLREELANASGAKKERLTKRVQLLLSLEANKIQPSWMTMTVVPIIPPDLRPMVPLDGGRFATTDLNDLYRRVINRNNRLRRLIELNAPEVIQRNEKRMLQEAVDALIDNNARHSKTVVASTGQKRQLKSLSDYLKGKQGRFRQNLLGKRIDYSGRSVIVVGPHLKIHECGLPKRMALELFKPFIISRLIKEGYVHNIRSASRFIETDRPEIWDILEDVTKKAHVLLNRAPTLHRLGIQAFQPRLIEGKAIQLHPLVCSAFNADFDGDQMAVHVPLTEEAKREAAEIMLASKNLLKPAHGRPTVAPVLDVTLGCYYLTLMGENSADKIFGSLAEARLAYNLGGLELHTKIKVRLFDEEMQKTGLVETSLGRLFFRQVLPINLQSHFNASMTKKILENIVSLCLEYNGFEVTATFLDDVKDLGYKYVTKSGYTWGMNSIPLLPERKTILGQGEAEVAIVDDQYNNGLLTDSEKKSKVIEIWTRVKEKIAVLGKDALDPTKSVSAMLTSGARGSWAQLTQMVGMKGLVSNPSGETIELPVKGNFKEGFDVLEYFISTHGTRKGLSDTALRTASAGYLTRRLVDVVQDVVVRADDCGDTEGFVITAEDSAAIDRSLVDRIIGRVVMQTIKDPETGKPIVKAGEIVTQAQGRLLVKVTDLQEVRIRSAFSCKLHKGVCKKCYGYDLSNMELVKKGVAVGIIAAQSIGEPGTQLTMRTFHTGGVAGADITQGLPRVEELFEARSPKRKAFMADVGGRVKIEAMTRTVTDVDGKTVMNVPYDQRVVKIYHAGVEEEVYRFVDQGNNKSIKVDIKVEEGVKVKKGEILFVDKKTQATTTANRPGIVKFGNNRVMVICEVEQVQEYIIPVGYSLLVKDGDIVLPGDALTDGSLDLQHLYHLKGRDVVSRYILREVQSVYTFQAGHKLSDKHLEIIVRQLFSRVRVMEAGDTDLLLGEIVEKIEAEEANEKALAAGREPAKVEELFLGISKVSLSTTSFLSAASFQETSKVLINAAVSGKIDRLEGLKENVIIGRLIPAGTGFKKEMEEPNG